MRAWILVILLLAGVLLPVTPATAKNPCLPPAAVYVDEIAQHVTYAGGTRTFTGYETYYLLITSEAIIDEWAVYASYGGRATAFDLEYGSGNACIRLDAMDLPMDLLYEVYGKDMTLRMWGVR